MTIEESLRKLLEDHRYKSSVTGQDRKMMPHHIDALMDTLIPWLLLQGVRKHTTANYTAKYTLDISDIEVLPPKQKIEESGE